MRTVSVKTGRPYEVKIQEGALGQFVSFLEEVYGQRKPKLAIITDDRVDALYAPALESQLEQAGYQTCKFVFPNGEASKNLATVEQAYGFLSENAITRSDVIIALGGGVVGDLAGFTAATWLRGIEFIQIPTTFLSMIDSSVGGKTGVDAPFGKNLIGAFWQPVLVVCDPQTLDTLTPDIYADGIAEAIKDGAIMDAQLFEILEEGRLKEELLEVIWRCIDLKRQVVEADERDHGVRQWLNFGHTLGHSVERETNFTITHGKGVSIGMALIGQAAERAGLTPKGVLERITSCCEKYNLPTHTEIPMEVLCRHAQGDKKRKGSKISLVVLEEPGKAKLYTVESDKLLDFMEGRHV